MNRTLLVLALAVIAPSIYAQNSTSTDPSASKPRAQVKSEIPRTGAPGTEQTEVQAPPKTNSTQSRGQVKSEIPQSGAPVTKQTEYQNPPKTTSNTSRGQVKSEIPGTGAPGSKPSTYKPVKP